MYSKNKSPLEGGQIFAVSSKRIMGMLALLTLLITTGQANAQAIDSLRVNEYLVLLNASGDTLMVCDSDGCEISSLTFSPDLAAAIDTVNASYIQVSPASDTVFVTSATGIKLRSSNASTMEINRKGPVDDDDTIGIIAFRREENFSVMSRILVAMQDSTAGAEEDGKIEFAVRRNGLLTTFLTIDSTGVSANKLKADTLKAPWIIDLDAIAWFPPSDSGAVIDTLENLFEVLNFYHNTDSTVASCTVQMPDADRFTSLDSVHVWVIAPNADGDSCSFGMRYRSIPLGGAANLAFSAAGRDTIDLGGSDNAFRRLTITGFTGIDAGEILDMVLFLDNTIANQVQAPVALKKVRIFGQ